MAKLVGICGTLSVGKTTLARQLAARLNVDGRVTEYAVEAAGDYIVKNGPPETVHEAYCILLEQMKREEDRCALDGVEFVVSDCPVFLNFAYVIMMGSYKRAKDRYVFADIYRIVADYIHKYWRIIYIPKVHEVIHNGIRQFDDEEAVQIDGIIRSVLNIYKIRHYSLSEDPTTWIDATHNIVAENGK